MRTISSTLVLSLLLVTVTKAEPYVVNGRSGPWDPSVNPAFGYGVGDQVQPRTILVRPGDTVKVSGAIAQGLSASSGNNFCGAGGYRDENGPFAPWVPADGKNGFSNTPFPSKHMASQWHMYLMELTGTFANDAGTIVGPPFKIGGGNIERIAPAGATRLQLGVNDDIFQDNQGTITVNVEIISPAIQLTDKRENTQIPEGGTAYIIADPRPAMPQLIARVDAPNAPEAVWDLTLTFIRPRNNPARVGDTLHLTATTSEKEWDLEPLLTSVILGGDATLTCTVGSEPPKVLKFKILGKNPSSAVLRGYSDSLVTREISGLAITEMQDAYWRILRHENRLKQFHEEPNPSAGIPVVSFDSGVGISQITQNEPDSTRSTLHSSAFWDWQECVRLGWTTFVSKISIASDYPGFLEINRDYRAIINSINEQRKLSGLKLITGKLAPAFTTDGLLGSEPPNQLLEDAVRGYNGFAGFLSLGGQSIEFNNSTENNPRPIALHEFIPDESYLATVSNEKLKDLDKDPRVWRRVLFFERPAATGNPDYVSDVTSEPSQ